MSQVQCTPVQCVFTGKIYLALRSHIGVIEKKSRVEKVHHRTVKNCHYCGNYIAINRNNFNNHVERCAGREGIEYSFDNNKIISLQHNFNFLGDVPFTVYFEFEIMTGDDQSADSRMYVISYCQIYTFQPSLNFEKVVVFRSFQQSPKKLSSLIILQMTKFSLQIERCFS